MTDIKPDFCAVLDGDTRATQWRSGYTAWLRSGSRRLPNTCPDPVVYISRDSEAAYPGRTIAIWGSRSNGRP